MTRIALWFASTVAVVALLFGYHTSTSGPTALSTTTTTVSSSGVYSGSSSKTTAKAGSSGGSKKSSGSTKTSAKTVTGSVVNTRWGPVQVQLTVTSGSIIKVSVLRYPNGNSRDSQINAFALPVLIKETIAKQTAKIDMVSGATYTSEGYVQSLQSALDQAGL